MATLGDLITRTQTLLSLAGGLAVQTYAQPKIVEFLKMGYATLFDLRFWDDYTTTETYDLNGTTGKTTQDLSAVIKSFRDIQYVWCGDYASPLPRAPDNRPPHLVRQRSFTTSADPLCLFKVLPIDTTGQVHVRYRKRMDIADVNESTEVLMDEELLVRWAAMMYVSMDNANQQAISTFTSMYTDRLAILSKAEDQHEKTLYSSDMQTVDQWYDA